MADAKRVLVADDEEGWVGLFDMMFRKLGWIVDKASNYHEVRELLDKNEYSLIVCDNSMPQPNIGLQLLAYVHKDPKHNKTPFVLHTADDSEEIPRLVAKFGGIFRSKTSEEPMGIFFHKLIESL